MTIYSYSRLKCFEQCPRKYKLKYVDEIRPRVKETVELFLGKRVHDALKKLYRDLMYQKLNTLKELLDFFRDEWNKKWHDGIVIVKEGHSPGNYLKMAEQCIINYYNRYKPFAQGRTIALEKRILVGLDGLSRYKLCGYIDRVAKTRDGYYEIHDYKTSSHLPTSEEIQNDRQLALYAMIVRQRYPYLRKVQLIWHYLRFNKEIQRPISKNELEKVKNDVIRLITKIESSEKFPANPSSLCRWCQFKSICQL